MKFKITSFFILLFLSLEVVGQTFNYQAVIRDSSGAILQNHTIGVQIKIYKGNPTTSGTVVYTETHTITTDIQGVVSLLVGKGTTSNMFSNINWSTRDYWLETSIDIAGGINYLVIGTSELQSVPYANYATKSGDKVFSTTANVTSNVSGNLTTDDFVFGSLQLDNDTSTTTDDFRFFFDKSKGAFRAGRVFNSDWNETNLGEYSIALGRGNLASENASFAVGESNTSSGSSSMALGEGNEATNYAAFAAGYNSIASGDSSVAMGDGSKATAQDAIAIGDGNIANSTYSVAIGNRTVSDSYGQVSLGNYNTEVAGNKTQRIATDRLFVIGNGTSILNRSDALTISKNGNTTLNGQLTIDADNQGSGAPYTLPLQDGLANQVMLTDGIGNVSWGNINSNGVFSTTANVTSNVSGNLTIDDFVFGSTQLDNDTSTTTDDFRFFFDKSKGAFRAGRVFNSDWDETNLGEYSIALGRGNLASENASFAVGESNTSSGSSSMALGEGNEATNYAAFAAGYNSIASGDSSVAMGDGSKATAQDAIAIGDGNIANSTYSVAIGNRTVSDSYGQVSLGNYNTEIAGNKTQRVATDRLFVIGNGTSILNRSDALTILKNGNTNINGKLTTTKGVDFPSAFGPDTNYVGTEGNSISFGHAGTSEDFIGYANNAFYFRDSPGGGDTAQPSVYAQSFPTYSSRRWKHNINDIKDAIQIINQLRGVTYTWNTSHGGHNDFGFIAEEVNKILPQAAQKGKDGEVDGVDYGRITPYLVEATKQQQKIIEEQQKQLKAQEEKLKNIEKTLQTLQQKLLNKNGK